MADRYWSYDLNDGLQWHDTAEAAERAADDRLTICRDEARFDGEWPDDVESICWGEVLGQVVEEPAGCEERPDAVDYHLAPVEETSERAVRLGCAGDGSPAGDLAAALDKVERLRGGEGLWSPAEVAVLEEREKQRHRWGDEHDDRWHDDGGLGAVAANLAHPDEPCDCATWGVALEARTRHDRRRQLVIAAALCIAEIERLDRMEAREGREETDHG